MLASYPAEGNPLRSGVLLHPEKIRGKAAALEVEYGKGRVFLYGFKPQWRGQALAVKILRRHSHAGASPVRAFRRNS